LCEQPRIAAERILTDNAQAGRGNLARPYSSVRRRLMRVAAVALGTAVSVVLVTLSAAHRVPLALTEVLGFVTGAWCVWLLVEENIWNWPIGIANNAFYVVVFWRARLFADMSLQIVYIVLSIIGWYLWLHGGAGHGRLTVRRTRWREGAIIAVAVVVITVAGTAFLRTVRDSAPFLDSLTTSISLAAQYMLTRKLIENWHLWIAVDVIYVGLYASRALPLTAVLYAIFLTMCIVGLLEWRRSEARAAAAVEAAIEDVVALQVEAL
jgi:nicotinamide mononucleotide transporter